MLLLNRFSDHNNNPQNWTKALAEDPTENGDFENRFDQSIVDAPHKALQRAF